jgi:hypothetical protein
MRERWRWKRVRVRELRCVSCGEWFEPKEKKKKGTYRSTSHRIMACRKRRRLGLSPAVSYVRARIGADRVMIPASAISEAAARSNSAARSSQVPLLST